MPDARTQALSPTRRHLFSVLAATGSILLSQKASAQLICPPPVPSGEATYLCFLQGGGNCFLRGTHIRTSHGERPIEDLAIGDLLQTERGVQLPVKWIGRQLFRKAGLLWPRTALPVRITRFAIDQRTPHTDLYLSPSHALLIDGLLMPTGHLVNGTSIVQAMPDGVEDIEYFHIELETHEVVFAEGAPAETLLVINGREQFNNLVEYERLYETAGEAMRPYAPISRYDGGRAELKALLRRLASPIVDLRDPIQMAYDRIAKRTENLV
jgi:hypothetical protein